MFCSATFSRGGEDVDAGNGGSITFDVPVPLFKCTRCKGCWYVSVEAQRSHWPLHKKHCRQLNQGEKNTISNYSAVQEVWAEIACTLPRGNHKTAALFRKLRSLLDEGVEDASELGMDMHTFGRTMMFHHSSEEQTAALWACPGMTNLFLGEDLLSTSKRETKAAFPLGLPSEEYVRLGELSEERRALARRLMQEEDDMGWGSKPGSQNYCYIFFNLLLSAAFSPGRGPSASSAHDGRGMALRSGKIAMAACWKAMRLWFDPMARESCGDAMGPAPSFAETVLRTTIAPLGICSGVREIEVFTVAIGEMLAAAIGEIEVRAGTSDYARGIVATVLEMQQLESRDIWASNDEMQQLELSGYFRCSTRSTKRRARLAFTLTNTLTGVYINEDSFGAEHKGFDGVVAELLEGVVGGDSVTRWAVWEAVATGHVGPGGHQDFIRAFYRHVQRRCTHRAEVALRVALNGCGQAWILPVDLVTKICFMACDPMATNVALTLKEWSQFKWPSSLTSTDSRVVCAGAHEQLLCCKLVMEPAIYAVWEAAFGKKPVSA
jgi:hypothetical protein